MTNGHVQSAERVIAILEHIAQQPTAETSLSEIATCLGVNTSTTHHLVATLFELGVLSQDTHSKRYRFGPKAYWLASSILSNLDVLREARPSMTEFVAKTQEAITLSILDSDFVLALDRISANGARPAFTDSARRAPVYCTAAGKVLVSSLPDGRIIGVLRSTEMLPRTPNTIVSVEEFLEEVERVRSSDMGIDRQEWMLGTICLATPIRDYTGEVVAAVSCGGALSAMQGEHLLEVEAALREVSDTTSAQLGFRASGSHRRQNS